MTPRFLFPPMNRCALSLRPVRWRQLTLLLFAGASLLVLPLAAASPHTATKALATKPPAAKPVEDAVARARTAFARGDLETLLALEPQTRADPLGPTVTAWRMSLQILRDDPTLSRETVTRFLENHAGSGAADRVRRALIQKAVEREAWPEARRHLEALLRHDPTSRCWLAQTRLATAATSSPLERETARSLLAELTTPNEACAAYFRAALAQRLIPEAWLIERALATAFEKGEKAAAPWRELLPEKSAVLPFDAAQRLLALAREHPQRAWAERSTLPPLLAETVARAAFLTAAKRGEPEAPGWSKELTPSAVWREPLAWQIRMAIAEEQWLTAWRLLEQLTVAEREAPAWRFWRAWTLKALGKSDSARALFAELAQADHFFGLLAAELLQQPRTIPSEPPIPTTARQRVAADPQVAAIRAFLRRGWETEAFRELELLAERWKGADAAAARHAAAALFAEDGRFDAAIRLLERSDDRTAWSLRYPTPWRASVLATAQAEGVDPAWVYGVMRQESRFRADARSTSGALGLMQVMPATGKWLAQKRNERRFHPNQLLEPETNLRFGITYLRLMTEQLDGHPVLATGAYNAGPGRIGRLRYRLDLAGDGALLDALRYIELLPLDETREYVRKVLANTVIYSHLLGSPKPLSALLLPTGNAQPQLSALNERLRSAHFTDKETP
ncbi:lytic transglycosylase domain-containing protein [Hydrogenophilus thiooxidans]|uniref:lytic transglycosylase domain-containing protein n=1 Tax=Hydrogenophilus thiooxidans TaxID=2820326 RepID=UPI001C24864A|nr:lytic transglycosylase domain-containing protein [Hydrogenophilus thiooxidans]